MAAASLTEPRCASERGVAMGAGRPAKRRFTVGGSGKSVARCHRTVLAYWKFESISLQRRVTCEFGSLGVEAAYRRGDLFDKRRQLAEEWARFCASGSAGPPQMAFHAVR
jgi:hypothetical protein